MLQLCGVAFILGGLVSVAVRRRAPARNCWLTAAASSSTAALSTALEELGADLDDPLWTARILRDQPELRAAPPIARSCEAGAEVVISASYQAPDELLAESVRIAREAGVLVAAASPRTARRWRAARSTPATTRSRRAGTSAASLLAASRPSRDFLAIETQPRAGRGGGDRRRSCDGLDCWVTFTCRDGERTWHGERIEDAVRGVLLPQVAAVGVNCTAPEHVDELLTRISTVTDLPLVAYPNAGRAYDATTKTWSGATSAVGRRRRALVGGCCGVRPLRAKPRATHAPSSPRRNCSRSCRRFGRPSQNSIAVGPQPVAAPVRRARDRRPGTRASSSRQARLEPLAVRDRRGSAATPRRRAGCRAGGVAK